MNKIVGAVVMMIIGYIIISYMFPIEQETIETIDTLRVRVPIIDTVYADADTVTVGNDTIASYRWHPDHELLNGYVDIQYNISSNVFGILANLELERLETLQRLARSPAPFRFGVGIAYFFDDTIMLSGEIEIRERVGLELLGRSDKTVGLKLNYRF